MNAASSLARNQTKRAMSMGLWWRDLGAGVTLAGSRRCRSRTVGRYASMRGSMPPGFARSPSVELSRHRSNRTKAVSIAIWRSSLIRRDRRPHRSHGRRRCQPAGVLQPGGGRAQLPRALPRRQRNAARPVPVGAANGPRRRERRRDRQCVRARRAARVDRASHGDRNRAPYRSARDGSLGRCFSGSRDLGEHFIQPAGATKAWDALLPTMLAHADALAACATGSQLLRADGYFGALGASMKSGTNERSLELPPE